ncbi:unnamed protein product [Rhizophagus irregularis]|nr:unnamed protein product [Rhizophagus irregularis]
MIWEYHTTVLSSNDIINVYGFTEDPNMSKYMVVMDYANRGNLRENLSRIVKNDWNQKLYLFLSICKGERPEIIENTPQCYADLMEKCWNEDPLKRPSSKEVLKIIEKWIYRPNEVNEELKSNIMEFINAPIEQNNNLATESHPQAYYKSRLLDFTSKKLNEILESEDSQAHHASYSFSGITEDLNDCIIKDYE